MAKCLESWIVLFLLIFCGMTHIRSDTLSATAHKSSIRREEDRRWFMEAMQSQTVDVVQRMKEITLVMKTPEEFLESQGVTPQDIEVWISYKNTLSLSTWRMTFTR